MLVINLKVECYIESISCYLKFHVYEELFNGDIIVVFTQIDLYNACWNFYNNINSELVKKHLSSQGLLSDKAI